MRKLGSSIGFAAIAIAMPVAALASPDSTTVAAIQAEMKQIPQFEEGPRGIKYWLDQIKNEKSKGVDHDDKKIAAYEQEVTRIRAQRADFCNHIIQEVQTAYGIQPAKQSGTIVTDEYTGEIGHWGPKFNDLEPNFEGNISHKGLKNSTGEKITETYPGRYVKNAAGVMVLTQPVAITWHSGDIEVGLLAFRFSPGYLAATLAHETIHFNQYTTKGVGDRLMNYDAERAAYDEMRKEYTALGLTKDEQNVVEADRKAQLKWANDHRGRFMITTHAPVPNASGWGATPVPEPIKTGSDADFLDGVGQLEGATRDAIDTFIGHDDQRAAAFEAAQRQALNEAERIAKEKEEAARRQAKPQPQPPIAFDRDKVVAEAERCGFTTSYPEHGPVHINTMTEYRGMGFGVSYEILEGADMDMVRMDLLFLRACLDAAYSGRSDFPLCNGSLSTTAGRWAESHFRGWTSLDSGNQAGPLQCIDYIHKHLEAPFDERALTRNAYQGTRAWTQRMDRDRAAEERQARLIRSRPSGGGGSDSDRVPRSGGGDGCPDGFHRIDAGHCGRAANPL